MPDFPKPPGGGVTPADVWGYGTRELTADTLNAIRDAILSDATKIPGGNVDAQLSLVKSQTDLLPTDPADQSLIIAATDALSTAIGTRAPASEYDAQLDAAVSSRAAIADYTAARAAKIDKVQEFAEDSLGTLSATGSEDTVRESTAEGILHCYIDLTNMGGGDSITVREFMKIKAAGSYIKYASEVYNDLQTLAMLHITSKPSKHGIKITLEQTGGTNRDYDWETFIEKAAA